MFFDLLYVSDVSATCLKDALLGYLNSHYLDHDILQDILLEFVCDGVSSFPRKNSGVAALLSNHFRVLLYGIAHLTAYSLLWWIL